MEVTTGESVEESKDEGLPQESEDPCTSAPVEVTKSHAVPVLDDLMKRHLYIGYSWEDRVTVRELLALLQSNGLICSLRSSLDVKEWSQADNINQGIIFSHKCLLYISPDYLTDPNSQQEFKKAEKKFQLLGRNSVFGIVQPNVKTEQLGGYEQFQLIFLKDGQTVQDCLTNSPCWDAILNDYELKSGLSLVPKENIGVGVAYTYFFSFLRIVIPGVWNSLVNEIQRQSAVKEPIKKTFLLKKMLIIIPKTLLSPIKLTDDTNFRHANLSIKQCFKRVGKDRREYTMPIYELTDNESGNVYYFVTDIPSCLYAVREAYNSELNIMSRDDVFETRNEFVITLKALLNHPENHSEFSNQWELLLWPDDDDNNQMKLSEFVSQEIKRKELADEPNLSSKIEAQREKLQDIIAPGFGLTVKLYSFNVLTSHEKFLIDAKETTFDKNKLLLDSVLNSRKCEEFVQALRESGQTHVANWIEGNGVYTPQFGLDWPLREKELEFLRINLENLIEVLDTEHGFLDQLLREKVINARQKEYIMKKATSFDCNEAFLEILKQSSVEAYNLTTTCLRKSNQEAVAKLFEEGGAILPIHATLEGDNVDEAEEHIVNEMKKLCLENKPLLDDIDEAINKSLLARLRPKVIAVKK